MHESFPSPENQTSVPIDQHVFERLDDITEQVSDPEEKEILEESVKVAKKRAFNFADSVLDQLISKEPIKTGKDEEEESHKSLTDSFIVIKAALGLLHRGYDWPARTQLKLKVEGPAFQYVLDKALAYRKMVEEERQVKEEVLKKLGIRDIVEPSFLEEKIITKFQNLPESIREGIFKRLGKN
jgi:hypothetical protein